MTGGIVAVLGPTGRNFAAGMSGGIAYVLDEAGDFESRCNLAMVALEPIAAEDDVLEATEHMGGDLETHGKVDISRDMTRYDALRLKGLIQKHLDATGSAVGQRILDDWAAYLPRFVKVMPVDYRRALEEMQAQQKAEKSAA
jgi:glutamate synthase (NADPH/NADH) large chain